jgi:hypothetical protein
MEANQYAFTHIILHAFANSDFPRIFEKNRKLMGLAGNMLRLSVVENYG